MCSIGNLFQVSAEDCISKVLLIWASYISVWSIEILFFLKSESYVWLAFTFHYI
jgi:hypothetical protein